MEIYQNIKHYLPSKHALHNTQKPRTTIPYNLRQGQIHFRRFSRGPQKTDLRRRFGPPDDLRAVQTYKNYKGRVTSAF